MRLRPPIPQSLTAAVLLGVNLCWAGVSAAQPAPYASKYTRVNDASACKYNEDKGGGGEPASCEYLCGGPIAGVKTRLLSCSDWEHLYFQIDGAWFSTWKAMTAVGGMAGLGNKNGLVEWVFDGEKGAARSNLVGLIVRFNGSNPKTNKTEQALAVFGLQKGAVCWKGNYADNASARAAVQGAACREALSPEK